MLNPGNVSVSASPHLNKRGPDGFQAIILAVDPVTDRKICGLTLAERGRRMALKAGAEQVSVVHSAAEAASLPQLARDDLDLLIVQVRDQIVHFPLIDPIRPDASGDDRGIHVAVNPDDADYAGALWIPAAHVAEALDTLSIDPVGGDAALAQTWRDRGEASCHSHGDIARHPVATRADRRGAVKMLFRLVHKPQDSLLSTYVNRRVSYPFTRALLPTPVTPNMLSVCVFFIGLLGCWFVAQGNRWDAALGCGFVLLAGYLDGCDGEVARLRHEGSKFGAWLDTVVDEVTTVLFLIAGGIHFYHHYPSSWTIASIVVGAVSAVTTIYIIYYYLIVVAKSGNSQDYPTSSGGFLDYLRLVIKRDFINLAALFLAIAGLMNLVYVLVCLGAVVTVMIMIPQHIALRLQLAHGDSGGDDGEPELAASSSGTFTKL